MRVNVAVALFAASSVALQVVPQVIPAGADDTEPPPEPARLTESGKLKRAPTVWAALMVTAQVAALAPEHAPLQPTKLAPGSGVAVSVTVEPALNAAEQ